MTTLEKIRKEIEQIIPIELPYNKRTPENIRDMVLDIIDKYETKLEPTEECDNDCEHCAYLECPKEPTTLKQIIEKHNMDKLAYDEMSDFERDVLKYAEQEPKTGHFLSGTHIPDNATNGDVFNAIYADISRMGTILMDDIENIIATNVNIGWWNSPYQKGGAE